MDELDGRSDSYVAVVAEHKDNPRKEYFHSCHDYLVIDSRVQLLPTGVHISRFTNRTSVRAACGSAAQIQAL